MFAFKEVAQKHSPLQVSLEHELCMQARIAQIAAVLTCKRECVEPQGSLAQRNLLMVHSIYGTQQKLARPEPAKLQQPGRRGKRC